MEKGPPAGRRLLCSPILSGCRRGELKQPEMTFCCQLSMLLGAGACAAGSAWALFGLHAEAAGTAWAEAQAVRTSSVILIVCMLLTTRSASALTGLQFGDFPGALLCRCTSQRTSSCGTAHLEPT